MARVLVATLPLHGHMAPLLPLVAELVARGDELVVFATPAFASQVESTGAQYRSYRAQRLRDLSRLSEKTEEISVQLMAIVEEVLAVDLSDMRGERPDYIIADSVAPWGQWAGAILDVPVVTSITTFAINRHVLGFAASHGVRPKGLGPVLSKLRHVLRALAIRRRLSRQYRVRGPGIVGTVFGASAMNIVHTSREFQPCGDTFDSSFHFVGPPTGTSAERHRLDAPPVAGPNRDDDLRPLIYVSLGTLFNADTGFYRTCLAAFLDQPVRVVMSIGSRVRVDDLGPIPTNVAVAASVRQLDVLASAAAFVTHGGMNSVSESLRLGVPMVTVPQMGEQEIVSRRIEQLGAGLYLAKSEVSAERLRSCVGRLIEEGIFRAEAARLGATLTKAGGTIRAAEMIQRSTRPMIADTRARG